MTAVLLQTKLHIPPLRPSLVSRPHLIERLNGGLHRKLTLVAAPAGFGKTTLVCEWISQVGRKAAWLALDEADADLLRFLTYFTAAVQTALPGVGQEVLAALQQPQQPSFEATLTALINGIAAGGQDFLLVLDDYHILNSPEVDECLAFLLEHQPQPMHLVITTRQDPALPLARLRARGQMTELRAADLRFSAGEAGRFLNQMMGLNLSDEDIEALERRTEGWIAGLQMAALSIQSRADKAAFIQAFTGSHRFVLDYLADEVLGGQSAAARRFLLQTSLLEQLSGPLCDAVTGRADGQEMLESLERGNLFVVHLDDERQWYRYHHLFADVLQAHLLQELPEQVPTLHRRASQWFARNQFTSEAIHHALVAQDFPGAADLIEMAWPALFKGFRPATWLGWVLKLPADLVRDRPVLNLGGTWTLIHVGRLEEAEGCLGNVERWLEAKGKGQSNDAAGFVIINEEALPDLPFLAAIARVYLAQAQGDTPAAIQYGLHALDSIPEDVHYYHGLAWMFLGIANWAGGDLAAAGEALEKGAAKLGLAHNLYFQIFALAAAADIKREQGRRHEAAGIYRRARRLAREQSGFVLRETADLYIGLAELHREGNDLPAAAEFLQKGHKELAGQAVFPGSVSRWYVAMARLKTAEGDLDGALRLLDEAQGRTVRDPIPVLRPAAALKARIWLRQDRLAEALAWARERGLSTGDAISYQREFEHLTLARILIARGRRDRQDEDLREALGLLARLLATAEAEGRTGSVLDILIQQALAEDGLGNHSAALESLQRALVLGEAEGYRRIFMDQGPPMTALLERMLAEGAESGQSMNSTIQKLLAAMGTPEADQPPTAASQPLVEPLSEREIEVLELVAQGLSNREIADRLFLALSTVKGHNRNIYGKLQVSRRTEAVAQARELGII